MAISLVGTATGSNGSGSYSITMNLPAGVEENDIVVVFWSRWYYTSTLTVTTAGYTDLWTRSFGQVSSYDATAKCSYKRMGATPDTSVTVSSDRDDRMVASLAVFRGVDTTTAIDNTVTDAVGYDTNPNCPAVTVITPGSLVVAMASSFRSSVPNPATLPGYTHYVQTGSTLSAIILGTSVPVGVADPPAFTGFGYVSYDAWMAGTVILRTATPEIVITIPPPETITISGTTTEFDGVLQVPQLVAEVIYSNPDIIVPSTAKPIVFICT